MGLSKLSTSEPRLLHYYSHNQVPGRSSARFQGGRFKRMKKMKLALERMGVKKNI